MEKTILLIHLYNGEKFTGQKFIWVEVPSSRALQVLLDHLTNGTKESSLKGSFDDPTESAEFKEYKNCLRQAFADQLATHAIVTQVIPGWPFEPTKVPYGA